MPDIITISKFVGACITIVGALVGLIIWLRPVKISPGVRIVFDGSGPDEIIATITNKSNKPIYVTRCVSRGVYPRRYTLMRHLRQPLMAPRFYSVIRFGSIAYDLLGKDPIKIDPQKPIDLRHRIGTHPLSKFHNGEFIIEVQLSTGRKFRSVRQIVPSRWRLQRAA
jgi:hypothetical protein